MKRLEVPEFATYQDEAAFWDSLDTADFMEDDGAWFRFETPTKLQAQRVTLDELNKRLRAYELKYGYSTIEFYRRYRDGELGDDDDMMIWAGLYHLYLTAGTP